MKKTHLAKVYNNLSIKRNKKFWRVSDVDCFHYKNIALNTIKRMKKTFREKRFVVALEII